MTLSGVGALWPSAENYARFKEACADQMPDTVEEYRASAGAHLDALAARGVAVTRLSFDPDDLAAWAAKQGTPVNSRARAAFAGLLFAERGRAH